MPHLAGKDRRGAVRTSTQRVGRSSEPVANRARVLVISGPSGAGKGTLIERILPRFPGLVVAVSATTRGMRPGEVDGEDYHFMTPEEFDRAVTAGEFLEHVEYAGNRYGTLRREVATHLAAGRSVVIEIELEGARAIRKMLPDAVTIFIAPPSMSELARRLERRNTDSAGEIATRLAVSRRELAAMGEFDHRVVNEDIGEAVADLVAIVARKIGVQPLGMER